MTTESSQCQIEELSQPPVVCGMRLLDPSASSTAFPRRSFTTPNSMKDTVYHYTDANGLLGILGKQEIWCSHLSYLNDTQEYRHAKMLYRDVLSTLKEDESAEQLVRRFAAQSLEYFDQKQRAYDENTMWSIMLHPAKYFVASFSGKNDELSQWRGYSGTGPRFSIGFRTSEMERLDEMHAMSFGQVDYESERASNTMRTKYLDHQSRLARTFILSGRYTDPASIRQVEYTRVNDEILEPVAPLLKHPKFAAEEEYRLHSNPSLGLGSPHSPFAVDFRPGRSFLIPYIKLPLENLDQPISSITVGPTPHMNEAVTAVIALVNQVSKDRKSLFFGWQNLVGRSEIPYRDW